MRNRLVSILDVLLPSEGLLDPERRALAASLDACATAVRRPADDWLAGVHPDVLAACEAPAVPLAALLRDRRVDVGSATLSHVRSFVRDRDRSPLHRSNPAVAAAALQVILDRARERARDGRGARAASAERSAHPAAAVAVGKAPVMPR